MFGTDGIIFKKEFPNSIGKSTTYFTVEVTEAMVPEVRGLVFYIQQTTGLMIFDEFSISPGLTCHNFLEVSYPRDSDENDDAIYLEIKTQPGSKVFIHGINEDSEKIGTENEVCNEGVYKELVNNLNMIFPNTSSYYFEKINAFVLDPLTNGSGQARARPSEFAVSKSENYKYIPNIWIEMVISVTTANTRSYKFPMPPTSGSWKLNILSIHPTKGLAISTKTVPVTIKVTPSVYLDISGPEEVYKSEVFKVTVRIANPTRSPVKKTVSIEVKNGWLVEEKQSITFNKQYVGYENLNTQSLSFTREVPARDVDSSISFLCTSKMDEKIKISAKLLNSKSPDEVKDIYEKQKRRPDQKDPLPVFEGEKSMFDAVSYQMEKMLQVLNFF